MSIPKQLEQLLLFWLAIISLPVAAADLPELDCIIEPYMTIPLSSHEKGVVEHIYVDRSDLVVPGQLLAQLESSIEQATVDRALAQENMERSQVKLGKANLQHARRKLNRTNGLDSIEAISVQEKDDLETEVTLALLELKRAEETLQVAHEELKLAQARLERRKVKSPICGMVVEQLVTPGEFVYQKPILTIVQLDPLRVEVIAPAEMFGKITADMQAEVTPESPGDGAYKANISIVDRVIDAASGTFGVRLELPNPDYKLTGGLKCRVQFLPAPKITGNSEKEKNREGNTLTGNKEQAETRQQKARNEKPDNVAAISVKEFTRQASIEKKIRKSKGYLVLVSAPGTSHNRKELMEHLELSGFSDLAPLPKKKYQDRISAGYFSKLPLAKKRRQQLKSKGFEAEIREIF